MPHMPCQGARLQWCSRALWAAQGSGHLLGMIVQRIPGQGASLQQCSRDGCDHVIKYVLGSWGAARLVGNSLAQPHLSLLLCCHACWPGTWVHPPAVLQSTSIVVCPGCWTSDLCT